MVRRRKMHQQRARLSCIHLVYKVFQHPWIDASLGVDENVIVFSFQPGLGQQDRILKTLLPSSNFSQRCYILSPKESTILSATLTHATI